MQLSFPAIYHLHASWCGSALGAAAHLCLPAVPPREAPARLLPPALLLPQDSDAGGGGDEGPHAGQLLLLKGISGSFRPGVLTALMGSSGAGGAAPRGGWVWGRACG